MINRQKLKRAAKPLYDKIESLKPRKIYEDSRKIVYMAGGERIETLKPVSDRQKNRNRFR